jgi:hypothetical protein
MPTATKPAPTTTKDGHRPEEVPAVEGENIDALLQAVEALLDSKVPLYEAVSAICPRFPSVPTGFPLSVAEANALLEQGLYHCASRARFRGRRPNGNGTSPLPNPPHSTSTRGGPVVRPSPLLSWPKRALFCGADGIERHVLNLTYDDFAYIHASYAAAEAGIAVKAAWFATAMETLKAHKANRIRDLPAKLQTELAERYAKAWPKRRRG